MTEAVIIGIFGTFIGSFLHVVYSRFGHWKSIAITRSRCPNCGHQLKLHELVPIASYVILRGRCAHCQKPISWEYAAIEVMAGVVSFLVWWHERPSTLSGIVRAVLLLLFVYVFMVMTLQDRRDMEVSDVLFVVLGGLGIVMIFFGHMSWRDVLLGALSAAAPLALLTAISREHWMGWGDVILAVSVGLVLGFPASIAWLYGSFVLGALWGVLLIALKIKKRRDAVPFIPILLLSFLLVYVWGAPMIAWYSSWMM